MDSVEKEHFANSVVSLLEKNPTIKLFSITVKKECVIERMRTDSNKLYNYMIYLSLSDEMCRYDSIILVPDPRSIKVKSGNSLHDYLDTQLVFEKLSLTTLTTIPTDSAACKGIQFADMLSGLVQNHFEDSQSKYWDILKTKINFKKLFFNGN